MSERERFVQAVDAELAAFVDVQQRLLDPLGPRLADLLAAARIAADGGKRLRATFCYAGWLVARGKDGPQAALDDVPIVRAASALEWLQASALVHDDVIDDSDTRRGRPAAHAAFAATHRERGWLGDPDAYGRGAAVLLGDLLLSWSDEMFRTAGFAPDVVARATPYLDACKTEVVGGQFLDLVNQESGAASVDDAMRVVRYKAAKYTVERPLHLGAALAGAAPDLLAALSDYAIPVGEAFQLRDDVLGVFGEPAVTGKPAGDDLREGKRTLLVAFAYEHADELQRATLDLDLGNRALDDAGVARLRDTLVATEALARTEAAIARLEEQAAAALGDPALAPFATLLGGLADQAVHRSR